MADLIDRKKLLHFLGQCMETVDISPIAENAYRNARNYVRAMEAVDAEPARHGQWVKRKGDVLIHWDCSECGIGFLDDSGLDKLKYCPSCGAKMDLKEDTP